ncbi:transcription factor IIIC subunit delta N-term-domain-containing protein [Aspergillus unguis]
MLEPVELQVFPSSYNCLSWSEDGEIAVAAGQDVQILSPKINAKKAANDPVNSSTTDWDKTRFRVNSFTINEWPIVFPQPRDHFSIGAEQSTSNVVGLAWSPPGLAKYRRSTLAVLTSNLILSLWAFESGKWTRLAIVNRTLETFFRENIESNALNSQRFFRKDVEDKTARTRKTNIRSFTWMPPLKAPARNQLYPGPECRWGFALLAITNEDNDLIFLEVRLPDSEQDFPDPFRIDAKTAVSLPPELEGYSHSIRPGSLFASAVQSQVRMLSLASGPWLHHQTGGGEDGLVTATVNVAAMQGSSIRVVKLDVILEPEAQIIDGSGYKLISSAEENTAIAVSRLKRFSLTGPIQWAQEIASGKISMAVGAQSCLATLSDIPEGAYRGQGYDPDPSQVYAWPMNLESTNDTSINKQHYERISGMAVAIDPSSETPILHFGTTGGYTATGLIGNMESQSSAPWNIQVEDIRERFDIDRDLGGLAVSRAWGIASMQGLVAAAVTLHPGDMVEYRTNSEDRLTIVFSTANGQPNKLDGVSFLRDSPISSANFLTERRGVVLQYILREAVTKNTLPPKVLYAAACCAIVQSQSAELLANARKTLEKLSATTGVDLTDEIAKCSEPGSTIEAKSADVLGPSGEAVFEKCEVCDAGIVWDSAQEAQCATGHVFGMSLQTSIGKIDLANCPSSPVQPDVPGDSRTRGFKILLQV